MKFKTYMIICHLTLLAIIGIMLASSKANAGVILNLHIGSYHTGGIGGWWSAESGELEQYNETNPGLGLSYQFNNNLEVRGGGYKNSHNANSFYLGGAAYTSSRRLLSIGAAAGVVTGYDGLILNPDFEYKKVQPFAMPTVYINTKRVRTEIGYLPSLAE